MLIYCPELSSRLKYVLQLLLQDLLGIEYRATDLPDEFIHFDGPKISYSCEAIEGSTFLEASGLLFEHQIIDQSTAIGEVFLWKKLPVFYKTSKKSILPFDIFSSTFYLLSRYEEYLPHEKDEHGRYPSSASLASREEFLEKPLINQWALAFAEVLKELFGDQISIKPTEYQFIPTIDIDNAWAFKNKGFRTVASFFRKSTMEDRNFRYQVLRGNQPDPFDHYKLLKRLFKEKKLKPVYFFLLGKISQYDRNVSPNNKALQSLINEIGEDFTIGIHPSYRSNENRDILEEEKEILERISGKEITRSRQHFLKLDLPDTYRALCASGIKEDYTMGYPDKIGFRASIANPFHFFDLENNTETDLLVYPFQIMDVSLQQYLNLTPEEAISKIQQIVDETKAVGGLLMVLWHNESLSEWKQWKGWSSVFKEMLDRAAN